MQRLRLLFTRKQQPALSLLFPQQPQQSKMAQLIDGKKIANEIKEELKLEITQLKQQTQGMVPGLAVVLVGNRPDSATYVKMKKQTAAELGITSFEGALPETATEQQVLELVRKFNQDPLVHGILVQLPLPKHINEEAVLNEVSIEKDVDGFHPLNIGKLSMKGRKPLFVPCTPKGCIELLDRYKVPIEGKNAVVVGRSNIVGIPVAMLLLHRNATVTICHSKTADTVQYLKQADIVIAACGVANYVRGDWLKPGCVVIDVGINSIVDETKKTGKRLVGDVNFDEAKQVASLITPVPGGVGPLTVIMLMKNTLEGFKAKLSKE